MAGLIDLLAGVVGSSPDKLMGLPPLQNGYQDYGPWGAGGGKALSGAFPEAPLPGRTLTATVDGMHEPTDLQKYNPLSALANRSPILAAMGGGGPSQEEVLSHNAGVWRSEGISALDRLVKSGVPMDKAIAQVLTSEVGKKWFGTPGADPIKELSDYATSTTAVSPYDFEAVDGQPGRKDKRTGVWEPTGPKNLGDLPPQVLTSAFELNKQSQEKRATASSLAQIRQAASGVETGALTGYMAQIQNVFTTLHIPFTIDPQLEEHQQLTALFNQAALMIRSPDGGFGMPGALSDTDREFMVAATVGLEGRPEAIQSVLTIMEARLRREAEMADFRANYIQKHRSSEDIDIAIQQEFSQRDMFTPEERKRIDSVRVKAGLDPVGDEALSGAREAIESGVTYEGTAKDQAAAAEAVIPIPAMPKSFDQQDQGQWEQTYKYWSKRDPAKLQRIFPDMAPAAPQGSLAVGPPVDMPRQPLVRPMSPVSQLPPPVPRAPMSPTGQANSPQLPALPGGPQPGMSSPNIPPGLGNAPVAALPIPGVPGGPPPPRPMPNVPAPQPPPGPGAGLSSPNVPVQPVNAPVAPQGAGAGPGDFMQPPGATGGIPSTFPGRPAGPAMPMPTAPTAGAPQGNPLADIMNALKAKETQGADASQQANKQEALQQILAAVRGEGKQPMNIRQPGDSPEITRASGENMIDINDVITLLQKLLGKNVLPSGRQ